MERQSLKKLYIVGNGFDLHHGLKTKVSDFQNYIDDNDNDLQYQLDKFFDIPVYSNYLWKTFEDALGTANYKSFFDHHNEIDPTEEGFRLSFCYDLENVMSREIESLLHEINQKMTDWIDSLKYPTMDQLFAAGKTLDLDPRANFLTFNYTTTLESLYDITQNRILYIHNNTEEYPGGLIYGHGDHESLYPYPPTFDENNEPTRHIFSDAEEAARSLFYQLIKPTNDIIKDNEFFFESLEGIEDVVVLGHSFGKSDLPYFKHINKKAPNAIWTATFYTNDDSTNIKNAAREIGIGQSFELINFQALLRQR